MYSNRPCCPGGHYWDLSSGTLSVSQVSATHLKIGCWWCDLQMGCSGLTRTRRYQDVSPCNGHRVGYSTFTGHTIISFIIENTPERHVIMTQGNGAPFIILMIPLTHWGRVTHIYVGNLAIIGSDNGLSPGRPQAIIWTNAGILLIGPLGTNFSEIWIGIHTFSLKKIHLKMLSGKWRPFCLGLNVLIVWSLFYSLRPSDACMELWTRPSLVQIMA